MCFMGKVCNGWGVSWMKFFIMGVCQPSGMSWIGCVMGVVIMGEMCHGEDRCIHICMSKVWIPTFNIRSSSISISSSVQAPSVT